MASHAHRRRRACGTPTTSSGHHVVTWHHCLKVGHFRHHCSPRAPRTRDVQRDSRRADNQITVAWWIWAAEGGTDMALLTFWKRSGSSVSLLWWHACAQTNAQWAQATERCSWRHASQGPPPDPVQCAVQAKVGLRACRQRTRAWSAMVCDSGHTLSN